jgi:hypothetical protein
MSPLGLLLLQCLAGISVSAPEDVAPVGAAAAELPEQEGYGAATTAHPL